MIDIEKRLNELKNELQEKINEINKLNQQQQIISQEILMIQGAMRELQNLSNKIKK
jgi:prefoldin subunit 5